MRKQPKGPPFAYAVTKLGLRKVPGKTIRKKEDSKTAPHARWILLLESQVKMADMQAMLTDDEFRKIVKFAKGLLKKMKPMNSGAPNPLLGGTESWAGFDDSSGDILWYLGTPKANCEAGLSSGYGPISIGAPTPPRADLRRTPADSRDPAAPDGE